LTRKPLALLFALTEKSRLTKFHDHVGYGLSVAQDGQAFELADGQLRTGADILVQHLGKKEGGLDKLKGKKIALVYHDSPFGKSRSQCFRARQDAWL
jgi:branched-chain amino acid transport system substrate-binding protein